jgi:hypothetical protein
MDIALVYDCIKFPKKVWLRQAPKESKKEENQALQVAQKPAEHHEMARQVKHKAEVVLTKFSPDS